MVVMFPAPSNMIPPLLQGTQLNHTLYHYVPQPMVQGAQSAQPDILLPAPRLQTVVHPRSGPQAVDAGFSYVNGEIHNTQYTPAYILTPAAAGPGQAAVSHTAQAQAVSANPSAGGTSNVAGVPQQYVDYIQIPGTSFIATPSNVPPNVQQSASTGSMLTAGQFTQYSVPSHMDNAGQMANNTMPPPAAVIDSNSQLWKDLKRQLEYYFSPQNLGNDKYLREHMDSEGYVPISLIANFNKVVSLTADLQLVINVLRDSTAVQVDEKGEKVRSLVNSGMLILREIPEDTPPEEVRQLFASEKCPPLISCHSYNNNNWLARFESHEDATRAYTYLRESQLSFRGQPVYARLKSTSSSQLPFSMGTKTGEQVTSPTTTTPVRQMPPAQYPSSVPPQNQQLTQQQSQQSVQQQQQPTVVPQPASAMSQHQQPVPPSTSQPLAPQQQPTVYTLPAAPQARVCTPQPVPSQSIVQQTLPGGVLGPGPQQVMQLPQPPIPSVMPTHQIQPGATVQLLPAPSNFATIVPGNAWADPIVFHPYNGPIGVMQLTTRQPTPFLYTDITSQRMVYQDIGRLRAPARPTMMIHPGFSNPPGANTAATAVYVPTTGPAPRAMRRDSNSRGVAPRPSSGSTSRYEYSVPRVSHPNTSSSAAAAAAAAVELLPPATVDVALSTDVAVATDSALNSNNTEPTALAASHAESFHATAAHHTETHNAAEPQPRRAPPASWRHSEREQPQTRPVGPRSGRRGGRHQDDSSSAKSWNSREPPAEQKFHLEANNFPPLTSSHSTSTDELLQNTCASGEVDHLNQLPKFSLGSTGTDHNIARDVVQITDNMSASCVIADGHGFPVSSLSVNDGSSAELFKLQTVTSTLSSEQKMSYAMVTQLKKEKPISVTSGVQPQPAMSPYPVANVLPVSDAEMSSSTDSSVAADSVLQTPMPSRHNYSYQDMSSHHHQHPAQSAGGTTASSHYQNDPTERHNPSRRGNRGGGGPNRYIHRTFYASDSATARGGSRWRGGANRLDRTAQPEEQASAAQIPTS